MEATLKQVKDLADDLKAKGETIITQVTEARGQIADLKTKLDNTLQNDPSTLGEVRDELQGIDDRLTGALTAAGAPPADTTT